MVDAIKRHQIAMANKVQEKQNLYQSFKNEVEFQLKQDREEAADKQQKRQILKEGLDTQLVQKH